MFGSSGTRSRKSLRRGRKIGRKRGIGRGFKGRGINTEAVLKIGGIVLAVAALVCVIIYLITQFGGNKSSADTKTSSTPSATVSPTPLPSLTVEELANTPENVTDPYLYNNGDIDEFVFSTGSSSTNPDSIEIYDMKKQQPAKVDGITKKNDAGLFEPKINDKYIVYLDCKSKDGGSIYCYDIAAGKSFDMRDYTYGKPKVSLSGKYALWLQQNLNNTDKLYLYDLETQECVTIEVFTTVFANTFISAPYMSSDSLVYVQPEGESQILNGSASSNVLQMCIIPLSDKGDTQRILGSTGTFIYEPQIQGNNIVYMDGVRDPSCNLMYCAISPNAEKIDPTTLGNTSLYDDKKNLTQPVQIAQGALNYCIGDGYCAYTLNDAVYAYYFADGTSRKISADNTKALLCSVCGKDVIWYDTTDGTGGDVPDAIMHVQLP